MIFFLLRFYSRSNCVSVAQRSIQLLFVLFFSLTQIKSCVSSSASNEETIETDHKTITTTSYLANEAKLATKVNLLLLLFAYCHYVIKYFMRDMMNYHCLRVFRSRVKRIGKPCECMAVPMLSCAVFRFRAPLGRYRLSTRSEDSVLQIESNSVHLIELLRQFSPSGYITPRRNNDVSSCHVE